MFKGDKLFATLSEFILLECMILKILYPLGISTFVFKISPAVWKGLILILIFINKLPTR